MDKKTQNEELQSRREFFKKAAKATLPMIAAVALASAPAIVNAANTDPMGCSKYGCGVCTNGCSGSCKGGCSTTCIGGCKNYACKNVAKN